MRSEPIRDQDLHHLSELARAGNHRDLARWVFDYRYPQLLAGQDAYLEGLRARYRELLHSYGRHLRTYGAHRKEQDYAYYRSVENLQGLAAKMLHLLDDQEVDKDHIRGLLARGEYELIRDVLAALRPNRPHGGSILDYERRLADSHLFLLEELIAVLTLEYDHRVLETRRRFESFLDPHRQALQAVEAEVRVIDRDLERLREEPLLNPEEKAKLIAAFGQRRAELLELGENESAKLQQVRGISEGMRDSVERFRGLLDSLHRALDAYRVRQGYVEKLARLGARVPDFRNLLESLFDTFRREVAGLQKSFRVFDRSFLETVFRAIDEQSVATRILRSPGRVVAAELELLDAPPAALQARGPPDTALPCEPPDLSFLRLYRPPDREP